MIQGEGGDPVIVQVPAPPDFPPIQTFPPSPWENMPPEGVVMIALAFIAASALVLWPLIRAFARRIEGRGREDSAPLREELMELRERVRQLEGGQVRLLELEERLDFAERLLADRGVPARLRGPEGA